MTDKLPIAAGSIVFRSTKTERFGEVLEVKGAGQVRVLWEDGDTAETVETSYLTATRVFTWKRWSGNKDNIRGVLRAEFGPSHVVFYGPEDHIIRAERIEQVNELTETTVRSHW